MEENYVFDRLPGNIRQMGECADSTKIYIEDYVMTYIRQIFVDKHEKSIVILLGRHGIKEAENCNFIYGAISVECDLGENVMSLDSEKWNSIYESMHRNFPEADILGWGCGVCMWNSKMDAAIKQIHKKYFAREGMVLFVSDITEHEEKMFEWNDSQFTEKSGFIVYYEKNPQMQDFMISEGSAKSIEAGYQDKVTENVRKVIEKNKKNKVIQTKHVACGIGLIMMVVLFLGVNVLIESVGKIENLENSMSNVEGYINSKQAEETISDKNNWFYPSATPAVKNTKQDLQQVISNVDATAVPKQTAAQKTSNKVKRNRTNKRNRRKAGRTTSTSSAKPASSDRMTNKDYRGDYQSYVVSSGDTLSQIVWKQYHSFDYLKGVMKANGITDSDRIYEGECIILPEF